MAKKYTKEQVLKAIKGSCGLYTNIAKILGCSHNTAKKYTDKWTETQEALHDETESVADMAENGLYSAIERGEPWAIKFYLAMKGQSHGYLSQPVVKVDSTNPLNINFTDITRDSLLHSDNTESYEEE